MNSVIQGDPVRHRTDGWTGIVAETPSRLANHAVAYTVALFALIALATALVVSGQLR